jgi:hypothetical protein
MFGFILFLHIIITNITDCCHRSIPFFPQDLNRFRTLQKANKELQAALKLSRKLESDDED